VIETKALRFIHSNWDWGTFAQFLDISAPPRSPHPEQIVDPISASSYALEYDTDLVASFKV
jgi:hypothetical protein